MWILELENIKCFKSKRFEFENIGLILLSFPSGGRQDYNFIRN